MGLISTSPISATFLVPVDIYFAHLVIAGTGQFSNGLVTPIMLELVSWMNYAWKLIINKSRKCNGISNNRNPYTIHGKDPWYVPKVYWDTLPCYLFTNFDMNWIYILWSQVMQSLTYFFKKKSCIYLSSCLLTFHVSIKLIQPTHINIPRNEAYKQLKWTVFLQTVRRMPPYRESQINKSR